MIYLLRGNLRVSVVAVVEKLKVEIIQHAKNNMRLYRIKKSEIKETIDSPDKEEMESNKKIAYRVFPNRFSGFPLKVVYVVEDDIAVKKILHIRGGDAYACAI